MDYVFCSANFFVFIIGSMVFGCAPETKRFQIFQDRDLSAKPDHGICIFNVIFHLFAESGPINSLLIQMGFITEPYKFLSNVGSTRG
mgnify:CR=1 FL=1